MKYIVLPILVLLASAAIYTHRGNAQSDNTDVQVNFVYAFELGFGSYDIGGLDVQVYSLPVSYTFHDLMGNEKLNLVFNSRLFYGRFRFRYRSEDGTKLKIDQDVLSYIPGLELRYEAVKNWHIKPFANAGLAWQIYNKARPRGLNVDDSKIFVYTLGITSLYQIFWERFTFSVGNKIAWAGNTTFDGDSKESYGVLENGLEAKHPVGFRIKGYEPDMSVYFNWYHFFPAAKFDRFLREPLKVENQYEIAGTVGSATPLKLWIVSNPRIGVGYRFGDLNAFTVNFGFPF